jgi:hypothetical protein
MTSSIFWDIMTRGPLKVSIRFRGTSHLYIQCRVGEARNQGEASSKHRRLVYSSTLKMEATRSSEMSAEFQRTTRRYIAEDRTFQS